ncbi:hypothetical protein LHGZ1_1571 [Laribacter hongkongensis]|uniref:Uncharacterized protein n=1 Tax=Laribacter hongkongensis TaxID=168471 RepID=A0A248LIC6_9NEIS|nr:hypothetical protein LHGZ1_1571 [Laribacter hongkongensis]
MSYRMQCVQQHQQDGKGKSDDTAVLTIERLNKLINVN